MTAAEVFDHTNFLIIDPYKIDNFPHLGMSSSVYVQNVKTLIAKIKSTLVGDALLRSIRFHRKWVRIWPQNDLLLMSSGVEGGGFRDVEESAGRDLLNRITGSDLFSTNVGAALSFFPNQCRTGNACHADFLTRNDYIPTPESVLLHELVHAFRRVSKKFNQGPGQQFFGTMTKYTGKEELYAIIVENMFQSEVKGEMRGEHLHHNRLNPRFSTSEGFFKQDRRVLETIETLCNENNGLTRMLAKLNVPFNPIAVYLKDPKAARAIM